VSLSAQCIDCRLFTAINKKINGFLRASVSGMKNPGALPGFPLFFSTISILSGGA
jgi:hypothetical protein